MSTQLDDLTSMAVAVPHDATRRKALADLIDDTDPTGAVVSTALRDDARAERVLVAVWNAARDRTIDVDYRLLWAVVTLGLDAAAPAAPPASPPRPLPITTAPPPPPPGERWPRPGTPSLPGRPRRGRGIPGVETAPSPFGMREPGHRGMRYMKMLDRLTSEQLEQLG